MVAVEQEVKSSQPERIRKWRIASARLCRLCLKTRMSEGGGHACADCRKRVCGRCGSYNFVKTNSQKVSGNFTAHDRADHGLSCIFVFILFSSAKT